MKIGILQTGDAPEQLQAEHGHYGQFFERLLAGQGFTFATWDVVAGELPGTPSEADGWLITGSRHGVYEDHGWIPPLEAFLRAAFGEVPIVGICFGHQILAQALGDRVEKYRGGWSVGAVEYRLRDGGTTRLLAWHQDQVVALPEGAEVLAQTEFCRYAMLGYGRDALTVQPHPEFTPGFARDLLEARREVLPPQVAATADLTTQTDGAGFAARIAGFFHGRQTA